MKKPAKVRDAADRPPAPTKGVVIARENRALCNNLTDEQRSALMARAEKEWRSGSFVSEAGLAEK